MIITSVDHFDECRMKYEAVLVHFTAADANERWKMSLYIEDCFDEMADPRIWDLEVDPERLPRLVERYAITHIPTLLVLIRGEEAARFIRKPWKKRVKDVFSTGLGRIDVKAIMRSIEIDLASESIPMNQNRPD